MENLLNILNILNKPQNNDNKKEEPVIPKEIQDQYPYGEFPIRYTKPGQESIRKNSENRYSYTEDKSISTQNYNEPKQSNNLELASLLPLIQLLTSKDNKPDGMMKILSKLLFKDNPELAKIFDLFKNANTKVNNQEINNSNEFPDTNKVNISSLKRVDK